MRNITTALSTAALLLLAVACHTDSTVGPNTPTTASVSLSVNTRAVADLLPPNAAIDSVTLKVSAPDVSGAVQYTLRPQTGVDSASITIIVPVGLQREFDVVAYSKGSIVGLGTTLADIVAGVNPRLRIDVGVVVGGVLPGSTAVLPIDITGHLIVGLRITPKYDTVSVSDTARFSLRDGSGALIADPIGFPRTWTYNAATFNPSLPGTGLILWQTPSTLCGAIDASGLLRLSNSRCDFRVIGSIGSVADTAFVHVR